MEIIISLVAAIMSAVAIAFTTFMLKKNKETEKKLLQDIQAQGEVVPQAGAPEKLPIERFLYFALKANMDFDTFPSDMPECNEKLLKKTIKSLGVKEGALFDKMVEWGTEAMDDLMEKEYFGYVEGLGTEGHGVLITRKWDRKTRVGRNIEGQVIRPKNK